MFAVAVHLYLIMRGFTFQFDDNNAQPLRTVPSIVLCVGGQLLLFLGFTSWRWVVRYWDSIAFVGLGAMMTSYSSACVPAFAACACGARHRQALTGVLTGPVLRVFFPSLWPQVRHASV